MVTTLRTKLLIGVAPLVVIMVALGLWAIVMFSRLGNNIDKILKENYRSVLAAEGMKESIERVDSAYLFAIGGEENRARSQYAENRKNFETHLQIELSNITLPGEREAAEALRDLRTRYFRLGDEFFAIPAAHKDERTTLYFARMLPTFNEVKREANNVLDMNQKNMEEERDRASHAALLSIRLMILGLLGAAVVATAITLRLSRTILEPIAAATRCARALARGDLDQVVPVVTRDELGELAEAFNTMARTIREFRMAGTARLLRANRRRRRRSTRSPTPSWSWIPRASWNGPTPRRDGFSASRPMPTPPCRGRPRLRCKRPLMKSSAAVMIRSPPVWTTPGASAIRAMSGFFSRACSPFAARMACSARRSCCPT